MIFAFILAFALLIPRDLPCPKHIEPMKYPQIARLAHAQGKVIAHVVLDPEGSVVSVSAKGHPMLADAVEKWIKGWTFEVSSKTTTDIVVEFKLLGEPPQWPATAPTLVTFDLPDRVTVVSQPPVEG
ncbi:MAG TPA: energy transducer TonB [Candidatus Angelobacter sp.]|nr:energy transducer TonB [Candidatus Angelobacter sp.]